MVQDRIEREIDIAAPPERVWQIITQAEHLGNWFGESAEIDLRPGGTITLRWEKHGPVYGIVEKIEQPRYFSFRWVPGAPGEQPRDGNTTLVEFTLTPRGAQTRLQVVETGFGSLVASESDRVETFESHSEGWPRELGELQQYVERLAA
jgi:uncharacterized protein YndB with AHSA1/START domain